MALLIPTIGETTLLQYMLGKSTPTNLTLKLYVNNYPPVDGSVASSFTEMSTQGYSAKTLAMSTWGTATTVSNVGSITYPQQTWTFDGTGGSTTIYGYYVVDAQGTPVLLWAELFATARTVSSSGDVLNVTPVLTLSKV
jgi:hypothetical protein